MPCLWGYTGLSHQSSASGTFLTMPITRRLGEVVKHAPVVQARLVESLGFLLLVTKACYTADEGMTSNRWYKSQHLAGWWSTPHSRSPHRRERLPGGYDIR